MPTYLIHGFRWPRALIRIHIILQNLDDAAAEWLIAPDTTQTLLDNFRELYPEIMTELPDLRFLEQYDPLEERIYSQPYAYVADTVHEVKLGVDVDDVRGKGVTNEQWSALVDLRDKLCPDEKVAWFVVVCGDEQRVWRPTTPTQASTVRTSSTNTRLTNGSKGWHGRDRSANYSTWDGGGERMPREQESRPRQRRSNSISRGFRRMFGKKDTSPTKSMKDLKHSNNSGSYVYSNPSPPPPLPRDPLPGTAV